MKFLLPDCLLYFFLLQVGNKADLTDRREVEFEVAAEFARENNIAYIETSVMRKSNIKVRK